MIEEAEDHASIVVHMSIMLLFKAGNFRRGICSSFVRHGPPRAISPMKTTISVIGIPLYSLGRPLQRTWLVEDVSVQREHVGFRGAMRPCTSTRRFGVGE